MNIQSMTGFGKKDFLAENFSLGIEIKSVNNRYLDIQMKMPRNLIFLEAKLKQALGQHIARGSVVCQLQYQDAKKEKESFELNEPVFTAFNKLLEKAHARLPGEKTVNMLDVLRWPDILLNNNAGEDEESIAANVLPLFEEACLELVKARKHEGEVLGKDIAQRIRSWTTRINQIEKLLPQRQTEFVLKMRTRIQELLGSNVQLVEDRIYTELGLMAERLDVTEEIVRLKAHSQHFLDTLEKEKSPGKKLGFLIQEFLREINTLGNKSQSADIQHLCVDWKEELEIIREQLANIE